jgi:Protein of unknown function (DUF3551)
MYRWETLMRKIIVTVFAAGCLAVLCAMPAQAVGTRHPFCLQGDEYPGLSYCTFDSYGQCMATASGRFLTCVANPYFAGESDDPYAYQNRNRPWRSNFPAPRYAPY